MCATDFLRYKPKRLLQNKNPCHFNLSSFLNRNWTLWLFVLAPLWNGIKKFDKAAPHWADEWRPNPLLISDSTPHSPIPGRHSNDRIIGWEAPFLKQKTWGQMRGQKEKGGVEGRAQTWIILLENCIQLLSWVSTLAQANQRPRQLLWSRQRLWGGVSTRLNHRVGWTPLRVL